MMKAQYSVYMMALLGCSVANISFSQAQTIPRTAFVHLFEWQWDDIARECEQVLGPKGFAAVQVSPPQKSDPRGAWWSRYQPVSYAIEGRSGNRSQFANMVRRCKDAGVDIYVDAVINHMAAYDRNFPEVPYGRNDFHNCSEDINYSNAWSVFNCDLVGLNDLKTESDYVRGKIADYMNDLIGLGVSGFRIDAAKHMPPDDINAIKQRLSRDVYLFQEVIVNPGEAFEIQPERYTWIAPVTEFNFTRAVSHHFKLRAPVSALSGINRGWGGWLSSENAVIFVANHDNQRQETDRTVTHLDGNNANNMAHVFMLGWPYGYPKVMSSYEWFGDHDRGPPGSGASACNNGWLCEHRSRPIANMVAFRNHTAARWEVTNYWDNGSHQMAWGRGGLGFVAINMEGFNLSRRFQTGMPEGTYCNIILGDFNASSGTCNGPTVNVDGGGFADLNVSTRNAAAIHVGARVENCTGPDCPCTGPDCPCTGPDCPCTGPDCPCTGPDCPVGGNVDISFTCNNGQTYWGQSVYVVGNHPTLGNWSPANAQKLDPSSYPTWSGTISLPANTDVEWKCLKREESNANSGVEWQGGDNNRFNTSQNSSPSAGF